MTTLLCKFALHVKAISPAWHWQSHWCRKLNISVRSMSQDAKTLDLLSWMNAKKGDAFALVQLNTPLIDNLAFYKELWARASLTAATDGSVNRLHHLAMQSNDWLVPNIISGDMDSAKPELLELYKTKGSEIQYTYRQDDTDFTKCLRIVISAIKDKHLEVSHLIVFDSFTGRLDHILGNINTLYLTQPTTDIPICVYSGKSLACLISQGKHTLHIDPSLRGTHCGYFPVGAPASSVSTTGLQWDVDGAHNEFGGFVSSCNMYTSSETVTIETSHSLLWTTTVKYPQQYNHDQQQPSNHVMQDSEVVENGDVTSKM